MKHILPIALLSGALLLSGCTSYNQFGATATGASLGGLFGSAIGSITGGYHGHAVGTVVGMATGAVMGAAASKSIEDNQSGTYRTQRAKSSNYGYEDDVEYSRSRVYSGSAHSNWSNIDIRNIQYSDANDNHVLEAGETANISFEIYNTGSEALYDVAPQITCNTKHVQVSPTAIVSTIEPGQGVRYRAAVAGGNRLKDGEAAFQVSFGSGSRKVTASTFRIRTAR